MDITKYLHVANVQYKGTKLVKPYCNFSNPSILYSPEEDIFYVCLRATNYTLKGKPTKCTPRYTNEFHTQNWIGKTKDPMVEPEQWKPVIDLERKFYSDKIGLEDVRLVRWKGKMYISGTRRDWNTGSIGRIQLSHIEEKAECWQEVDFKQWEGTVNDRLDVEKNWSPVLDKPLHYIVSNNPLCLVQANPSDLKLKAIKGNLYFAGCNMLGCLRGSSQVIPYDGGYFSIIHHSERDKTGQHHYFHKVAWYPKDFSTVRFSDDFVFDDNTPIQFSCGAALKNDTVYISYSIMDSNPHILSIPIGDLARL